MRAHHLLLCFSLLLTSCAIDQPRPTVLPPQYVIPVPPGDSVTVHAPAPVKSAPPRSASADVIRTHAAAPVLVPAPAPIPSPAPAQAGYDAELTNYEYPFDVHDFALNTQDEALHMAYLDEQAPRPNGRVVVLLHGANFTSAYWRTTILSLIAQGFRVIAPDQIGFGKSSKPVRYQFSFATLCDNTRRLLDSLHVSRFALVGHSMGGMMAVRCALQFPSRVERVALVSPLGLEDWPAKVPYQSVDDAYHAELSQTEEGLRAYMRDNYFGGVWSPLYDELLTPLAGQLDGPDHARVAWDRALVGDMIFTQPILQDLPRLSQPTLLLIGDRDRTAPGKDRVSPVEAARLGDYPSLGRRAARLIPHATLTELSVAGHLPQLDDFEGYIKALGAFLGK